LYHSIEKPLLKCPQLCCNALTRTVHAVSESKNIEAMFREHCLEAVQRFLLVMSKSIPKYALKRKQEKQNFAMAEKKCTLSK